MLNLYKCDDDGEKTQICLQSRRCERIRRRNNLCDNEREAVFKVRKQCLLPARWMRIRSREAQQEYVPQLKMGVFDGC